MSAMLYCNICQYKTLHVRLYVSHYRLHGNIPSISIPCGYNKCCRTFRTVNAFKTHISRDHGKAFTVSRHISFQQSFRCTVEHCAQLCDSIDQFVRHIRSHIVSKTPVNCPFNRCNKHFADVTVSTFNSHISRAHRHQAARCIAHKYCIESPLQSEPPTDGDLFPACTDEYAVCDTAQVVEHCLSAQELEKLLLNKLALFTLNLQVKHHVPASVVQAIITELSVIVSENADAVQRSTIKILTDAQVNSHVAEDIIHSLINHPLRTPLDCDQGPLRTMHMRTAFYKQSFNYIEPVAQLLTNCSNETSVFQYIPIKETLKALFRDPNIEKFMKAADTSQAEKLSTLHDCTDGLVCRRNSFLRDNENAIKIILY